MASGLPMSFLRLMVLLGFCVGYSASALFSGLPKTLVVSASPKSGQVLYAGKDQITVSWHLNQTLPHGADASYKKVKVRLCYAPVSQQDRAWRKTKDDLTRDKTCQFGVAIQPYSAASNQTVKYTVERDVPTATYFIRAYVLDASGTEVAYGQTTGAKKDTNLFEIQGISGRHASLDIAAACFSAFSIVALVGFFVAEKRRSTK